MNILLIKGNILDILVTDFPHRISNVAVLSNIQICNSDHFPIEFKVTLNALRKKAIKRSVYNFKKANWKAINSDFSTINWHHVSNSDNIENAWKKFILKFCEICNKHIPKIKISNEFKPPWYDSDVFVINRKKNRSHTAQGGAGTFLMEHNGTFRKSGNLHPPLSERKVQKSTMVLFEICPRHPPPPLF